jgi:uncharacterized protein (TIGR03905 family)
VRFRPVAPVPKQQQFLEDLSMSRRHTYNASNHDACCTRIEVELEGDTICEVRFTDGCYGNHQGMEALVKGMKATDAIQRLQGIRCRNSTSCPDQLAEGLRETLAQPSKDA